ncbi:hypothetical protein Cgig2_023833 [Carnegiea gigantea]|uniref:Uncharacterized protein n=1 Tax=Carnegiea gigantea TaxID=171969 RepID=A0A9Q1K8F3_9CARY|nr:hypothetical protein Cgig2_023833 [Carnegiea gigantea]
MDGRKEALGMNKKSKLLKRTTRNTTKKKRRLDIIRGIIKYLKYDSYFYSPLLSSAPTHRSSAQGLEMEEPLKKNEGNFREKVVDYLKSDMYLYARLGDPKSSDHFAAKNVISPRKVAGHERQFKKVNNEVPSRETLSQTKQAGKDSTQTKQVPVESTGEKQGNHISKAAPGDAVMVTPSTPELLEVKRTVIRRSYHTRLSTISGN